MPRSERPRPVVRRRNSVLGCNVRAPKVARCLCERASVYSMDYSADSQVLRAIERPLRTTKTIELPWESLKQLKRKMKMNVMKTIRDDKKRKRNRETIIICASVWEDTKCEMH